MRVSMLSILYFFVITAEKTKCPRKRKPCTKYKFYINVSINNLHILTRMLQTLPGGTLQAFMRLTETNIMASWPTYMG